MDFLSKKGENDLELLTWRHHFGIFAQLRHLKSVNSASDVLKERRISRVGDLSLSHQRLTSAS